MSSTREPSPSSAITASAVAPAGTSVNATSSPWSGAGSPSLGRTTTRTTAAAAPASASDADTEQPAHPTLGRDAGDDAVAELGRRLLVAVDGRVRVRGERHRGDREQRVGLAPARGQAARWARSRASRSGAIWATNQPARSSCHSGHAIGCSVIAPPPGLEGRAHGAEPVVHAALDGALRHAELLGHLRVRRPRQWTSTSTRRCSSASAPARLRPASRSGHGRWRRRRPRPCSAPSPSLASGGRRRGRAPGRSPRCEGWRTARCAATLGRGRSGSTLARPARRPPGPRPPPGRHRPVTSGRSGTALRHARRRPIAARHRAAWPCRWSTPGQPSTVSVPVIAGWISQWKA